jgi:predicted Zn-dependent protease
MTLDATTLGDRPDPAARIAPLRFLYWVGALLGVALAVALVAAPRRVERGAGTTAFEVAALERRAAARPDDPETLLVAGEGLRRRGEPQRALDLIAPAYDTHFREPRFSAAMAELLLETGQVQDAYAVAAGELSQVPGSGELHATLAIVLLRMGRYDRALDLARQAVVLEPHSPRAWRAFSDACAVEKRLLELWPAFDRAIQLAPDDGGLLADYGEALVRYGRMAAAEAALRRALELRPRDPRVAGLLGSQLGQHARTAAREREAIALLEKAAALGPQATEPRYRLGNLLLLSGRAGAAVPILEECLRLDPSFAEAWLPLAQAYQRLGRAADADRAFAAYARYADYRREASQLTLRLRQTPESVDLLLRMAALQEHYGRHDLAARYYRQSLRLRPDPAIARAAESLERAAHDEVPSPRLSTPPE